MELLIGAAVVVLLGLITVLGWAVVRRSPVALPAPGVAEDTRRPCPECAQAMVLIGQLQTDMQTCRSAVAEGIEHVDRVENRIRGTIKRARKQLEEGGVESPGLEAEASGLSLLDGGGGEQAPVHVVPPRVADAESSIPGVSPEQLRRVRGI